MQNNHSCSGNCGNCGGCARELTLNEGELRLLDTLSEIPFLPVAREMGDLTPVSVWTTALYNTLGPSIIYG